MQQLAKCKMFTHRFPSISPTRPFSFLHLFVRTSLFMSFQKIWLEERSVLFPLSGGNHWITERNWKFSARLISFDLTFSSVSWIFLNFEEIFGKIVRAEENCILDAIQFFILTIFFSKCSKMDLFDTELKIKKVLN